jgi:predicted restriction endonuclease
MSDTMSRQRHDHDALAAFVALLGALQSHGVGAPATLGRKPYKGILLLAIIDRIAAGLQRDARVDYTADLLDACEAYAARLPEGARPAKIRWFYPYWHLRGEGRVDGVPLWSLVHPPEVRGTSASLDSVRSERELFALVEHARIHPAFVRLAQEPVARTVLRETLIAATFAPSLHPAMRRVGALAGEGVDYLEALRRRASAPVRLLAVAEERPWYAAEDLDDAFATVVLDAYDTRCAVCAAAPRDLDGGGLVMAQRLVPRALFADHPRLGMALCPAHARGFAGGGLAVAEDGVTILRAAGASADLGEPVAPARLRHLPARREFQPAPEALAWHRAHRFRPD